MLLRLNILILSFTIFAGKLHAEDEDLATALMRATIKIGHDRSMATGFVLERPDPRANSSHKYVLVTAAHVLDSIPGDEATLYFRTKKDADGQYWKLPVKLWLKENGRAIWTKHPFEDVACIGIELPEKADLPKVSTRLLATEAQLVKYKIHPGDQVGCIGYPHREESNGAGFPVLRSGPIASFPLTPIKIHRFFLLSTHTFEGDSGSPIYISDSNRKVDAETVSVNLILGLMTAQRFLDEDLTTIYGQSKTRHRLGLGVVVQAPYIQETIDRLP